MTKILAYTSPSRGHLYPVLPTLVELVRRGHDVEVLTLASELETVRSQGVRARAIAPEIEARELDDGKAGNPLSGAKRVMRAWLDRAPYEIAELRDAIEERRPDVLLVDVNSWGAMAAAEASKLPFAVFSPYFLDLDLPGRPPFGPGLAPRLGLFGALRDRILRFATRVALTSISRDVNTLRSGLGLPPAGPLGELALRANRVLYFTAEPFEYTHGGWPENVKMIGPGLYEAPSAPTASPSRPVVLVTCSTELQDDARLIEVALGALAGEDVDVIATTAAIDPVRFRPPPNAHVVRYAAHGPILAHAAAVVCHGGMGITQKALAAGVPVCVVPFGRDQLEVARHVEVARAGVRLPPRALSVERLRDAVRATRGMREGAQRIARAFEKAGGARAAADALEAIVPRDHTSEGTASIAR